MGKDPLYQTQPIYLISHILAYNPSSQRPFLLNCLADDAQRFLNYYSQASEIFYNIISLGLDSPTLFPKGPTSEKTKGKRRRRCRIDAFILLVKEDLPLFFEN